MLDIKTRPAMLMSSKRSKQMATFKERSDARVFIRNLEKVSNDIAAWAQQKVEDGWTVEDIKLHLKNVAKMLGMV